ncbi:hypothetical protein PM082_009235 [Marasmius tenuissimus]|nr:hypothetical protein PM082_009235 [Marasmius tenuissimus]
MPCSARQSPCILAIAWARMSVHLQRRSPSRNLVGRKPHAGKGLVQWVQEADPETMMMINALGVGLEFAEVGKRLSHQGELRPQIDWGHAHLTFECSTRRK